MSHILNACDLRDQVFTDKALFIPCAPPKDVNTSTKATEYTRIESICVFLTPNGIWLMMLLSLDFT